MGVDGDRSNTLMPRLTHDIVLDRDARGAPILVQRIAAYKHTLDIRTLYHKYPTVGDAYPQHVSSIHVVLIDRDSAALTVEPFPSDRPQVHADERTGAGTKHGRQHDAGDDDTDDDDTDDVAGARVNKRPAMATGCPPPRLAQPAAPAPSRAPPPSSFWYVRSRTTRRVGGVDAESWSLAWAPPADNARGALGTLTFVMRNAYADIGLRTTTLELHMHPEFARKLLTWITGMMSHRSTRDSTDESCCMAHTEPTAE